MATVNLSTAVNEHYLSKVMQLTDVMDVAASEDILDARGMKLVAKGTHLTRSQQTTLGLHKLSKPLEATLVADGAVDVAKIVASAGRILDTSAPLRLILGAIGGSGPSPQALLSICMAKKLRMTPEEQMVAALAGLLHDIGELYIDPAYLRPGRRLLPHEWAHLVVHPRIGQMLIADLESYPASVGRAVAEHHERADATGYPRQLRGKDLSPAGQAVSVAEMIAAEGPRARTRRTGAQDRAGRACARTVGRHLGICSVGLPRSWRRATSLAPVRPARAHARANCWTVQ